MPNKTNRKYEKRQPQGRIVDLLKKQAQQPPKDTGSGLRPTEVSFLSRGGKKVDDRFKRPAPPDSGTAAPAKRRPPGSLEKAVEGTHRTLYTTRDRCLSPAVGHAASIDSTILTATSDINIDPKSESLLQSSATSGSGLLSRSRKVQALSIRAPASRSSGLPTGAIESGFSSAVHRRAAILSQREASPVSPFTYKKRHLLNSKGYPADLRYSQSPREIPDQASMTFTSPPNTTSMHACQISAVEATHTHHIVENQSGSINDTDRGAHMYSIFPFGARLIVLSAATLPRIVSPTQSTLAVMTSCPMSDLPFQCEPDELSNLITVPTQAISLNLPTPEIVDASRPAPSRTRKSAYDHPALKPSVDNDCEWSTLSRRKPQPRGLSNNLITISAKFRLPIRSHILPPTTENHERTEKRPRITLYNPPSRTVTVDLAGIESRYALVRGTMRKVRTLIIITDTGLPSLFQCA